MKNEFAGVSRGLAEERAEADKTFEEVIKEWIGHRNREEMQQTWKEVKNEEERMEVERIKKEEEARKEKRKPKGKAKSTQRDRTVQNTDRSGKLSAHGTQHPAVAEAMRKP